MDQNAIYEKAVALAEASTEDSLEEAMALFRSIRGWADADERFIRCRTELGRMRWQRESTLLKEEEARFEKKVARWRKVSLLTLVAVLLCIAVLTTVSLLKFRQYNRAAELFTAGEYERSAAAFQAMDGYKDAKARVFMSAVALYNAKRYAEALPYFVWLDGYIDNGYYLKKCRERLGIQDASAESVFPFQPIAARRMSR